MYKQIIVIRNDLKMGKGKMAAQASHASLEGYEKVKRKNPDVATNWKLEGMKKVVLKVQSENELLEYFEAGQRAEIPCAMIRDAGHTQIEAGSITCFAAGPWKEEELDKVFGKLKLL